jgi:hypothetical protein
VRALSLWQPWASLMGRGKTVETRSWETLYRGRVAIHATQALSTETRGLVEEEPFRQALGRLPWTALPRGAVVAVATLVDCRRTQFMAEQVSEDEWAFGDFSPNRFAWIFDPESFVILPKPILAKGARGLWDWGPPAWFVDPRPRPLQQRRTP